MSSDAGSNQRDYMKGRDYVAALFAGKYFILIIMGLVMALTAVYSYSYLPKNQVSVVLKPGSYVGESGTITPVLKPQSLARLINEGFFNGLIQRSLGLASGRPITFDAANPDDTDIIKVTYTTDNAARGLNVLRELLAQLSKYYDQERTVKVRTVSSKFLDTRDKDLSALETARGKKIDEKKALLTEKDRLQILLAAAVQDKTKGKPEELGAQVKTKEKEIKDKEKEIANVQQEISGLRRQNENLSGIVKQGAALVIIQEPMVIAGDFKEALFRNIFVAGVLALVFGILLQFIVYDFKMGKGKE